jgi:hypothetical protein
MLLNATVIFIGVFSHYKTSADNWVSNIRGNLPKDLTGHLVS